VEMNPHNSCCPLAPEALEAPADLLELELLGYTVYPVARIQVLHSDPGARYASLPIHRLRVGRGHHDLVLSGTYRTRKMSRAHVSEADERAGIVLACRLIPESDLAVKFAGA